MTWIYLLIAIYPLPTIVAFACKMSRKWDLFMWNILLGWIPIIWLACAAVVWSEVAP